MTTETNKTTTHTETDTTTSSSSATHVVPDTCDDDSNSSGVIVSMMTENRHNNTNNGNNNKKKTTVSVSVAAAVKKMNGTKENDKGDDDTKKTPNNKVRPLYPNKKTLGIHSPPPPPSPSPSSLLFENEKETDDQHDDDYKTNNSNDKTTITENGSEEEEKEESEDDVVLELKGNKKTTLPSSFTQEKNKTNNNNNSNNNSNNDEDETEEFVFFTMKGSKDSHDNDDDNDDDDDDEDDDDDAAVNNNNNNKSTTSSWWSSSVIPTTKMMISWLKEKMGADTTARIEWIMEEGQIKMKAFGMTLNDTAVKFHDGMSSTWKDMTTDTKIKSVAGLMLVIGILVGATGMFGIFSGGAGASKTNSLQHSLVMDQIESLQMSVDMIRMEHTILKSTVSEAHTYMSVLMEELGSKQNHIGRTVNIMKELQGKSFVETMTDLTCSSSLQQKLTDVEEELLRSKQSITLLGFSTLCLILVAIRLSEDSFFKIARLDGMDHIRKKWLNGLKIFIMISALMMIVGSFSGVGAMEHEPTMGRSTSKNFQNVKLNMKNSHIMPEHSSTSKLSKLPNVHTESIFVEVDQDREDTMIYDFSSAKSPEVHTLGEIPGDNEPDLVLEDTSIIDPQVSRDLHEVAGDKSSEDSQQAKPNRGTGNLWYWFLGWMLCSFALVKIMTSEQKWTLPPCYSSQNVQPTAAANQHKKEVYQRNHIFHAGRKASDGKSGHRARSRNFTSGV